jgi:hypothetical protein
MRKSMHLCVAATVYMLILLATYGHAMSQERSKLVDTGVIFSAEQLERLPNVHKIGVTPPYWTPSPEEIALLEARLKPYLEGATPPEARVIAARLGSYKRQYLGFTHDGKRWILVNGFCEGHWKEEDTWRDRVVLVLDGGLCYFKVLYDPSRSQFEHLLINGAP